jgi:hypothetical protein
VSLKGKVCEPPAIVSTAEFAQLNLQEWDLSFPTDSWSDPGSPGSEELLC